MHRIPARPGTEREEDKMRRIRKNSIRKSARGRVGPLGLSLAAAAVTAVAFAAISMAAQDDGKPKSNGQSGDAQHQGRPPGPPMAQDLSAEDRQKLEDFRSCMSDQGVDPPPAPGDGDGTFQRRVKPPSDAQRQKMEKAFEACKDKLPDDAQALGPPGAPGGPPCGPPPGPPRSGGSSNDDSANQGAAVEVPDSSSS
jgi:hypothetical protein